MMKGTKELWKNQGIKLVVESFGIALGVGYLFYDTFWGILAVPLIYFFLSKNNKRQGNYQDKEQLIKEFSEVLKIVESSLVAGNSLEHAFVDAQKEIYLIQGDSAIIYGPLKKLNQSVAMNRPIEKALEEFALSSNVEEIITFSQIVSYAKRSGGNLVDLIQATSIRIQQVWETQQEIEILITSKKYELKIMSILPLLIILYLKWSFGEYLSVLYGNLLGIVIMTICLTIYLLSFCLGKRLLKIEV